MGTKPTLGYPAGQEAYSKGQAPNNFEMSLSSSETKFYSLECYCFIGKSDIINLIPKSTYSIEWPSFKLNIGWGRVSPFFSIHSFIHSSVCLFGRGRLMQWEVCLLSQNRV